MSNQDLPLSGLVPARLPLSLADLVLLSQKDLQNNWRSVHGGLADLLQFIKDNSPLDDVGIANLGYLKAVAHGTTLMGLGTSGTPLDVRISAGTGNLLQSRLDGIYYGVEAPPDISNLYVDSLLGDDSNPGTLANPFRTLNKALSKVTGYVRQVIYLKCGNDRPDYLMDTGCQISGGGSLMIHGYGDPYIDGDIANANLARRTSDPNYINYEPEAAEPVQRPRIRGTYVYENQRNLVYSNCFNVINGGYLGFLWVDFRLNFVNPIEATTTINYRGGLMFGDDQSLIETFSCYITDDRTVADVYTAVGNRRGSFLMTDSWLGKPSWIHARTNLRVAAAGRATNDFQMIASVGRLVKNDKAQISPGFGVAMIVDNLYEVMDAYGEAAVLDGIIRNYLGLVVTPISDYGGFVRPYSMMMNPASFSKGMNGFTYLPNGLILQWGTSSVYDGSYINFPIVFPNACYNVQVTDDGGHQPVGVYGHYVNDPGGFNFAGVAGGYGAMWQAIGS